LVTGRKQEEETRAPSRTNLIAGALAVAAACVVPQAPARAAPAQDQQVPADYRLTMPVVEKLAKANGTAAQATAEDPRRQG
jgi:hypothetical protein